MEDRSTNCRGEGSYEAVMKIEDKHRGYINENGRGNNYISVLSFTSRSIRTHDGRKRVRDKYTNRETSLADCRLTVHTMTEHEQLSTKRESPTVEITRATVTPNKL
eukprot:8135870-Heterocapsa_arctica.AAC.1